MTDEELKQLIASNAKAIEALTANNVEEKRERQRLEKQTNQALSKMATAMAQWRNGALKR